MFLVFQMCFGQYLLTELSEGLRFKISFFFVDILKKFRLETRLRIFPVKVRRRVSVRNSLTDSDARRPIHISVSIL